ncbi:hypothetical protein HYFRA_00006699 [Hymenoscyphus fraxineus]|uniref:Uncharacterized protein n=1 Tax=Hymenoscyphus fraxineus TaxID=746836 RepID=A0A9N9KXJ1_9HELO|nr:hypothetical protein HYFRA_00006699 [Hymenoscyphus fraxineus]
MTRQLPNLQDNANVIKHSNTTQRNQKILLYLSPNTRARANLESSGSGHDLVWSGLQLRKQISTRNPELRCLAALPYPMIQSTDPISASASPVHPESRFPHSLSVTKSKEKKKKSVTAISLPLITHLSRIQNPKSRPSTRLPKRVDHASTKYRQSHHGTAVQYPPYSTLTTGLKSPQSFGFEFHDVIAGVASGELQLEWMIQVHGMGPTEKSEEKSRSRCVGMKSKAKQSKAPPSSGRESRCGDDDLLARCPRWDG